MTLRPAARQFIIGICLVPAVLPPVMLWLLPDFSAFIAITLLRMSLTYGALLLVFMSARDGVSPGALMTAVLAWIALSLASSQWAFALLSAGLLSQAVTGQQMPKGLRMTAVFSALSLGSLVFV